MAISFKLICSEFLTLGRSSLINGCVFYTWLLSMPITTNIIWVCSFPIIAGCLEVCAGCPEVSSRVALRSDCGVPRGPCRLPRSLIAGCLKVSSAGRLEVPKFSILGVLLALPTKTSFSTPHYYPKYEVWALTFFCGRNILRQPNT